MDKRNLKINAAVAVLAGLLGVGVTRSVQGQAAPETSVASVRLFQAAADGGTRWAVECCAAATTGDGGTIVEQGCESAMVPAAWSATVDGLAQRCAVYWKAERGVP